jgi:oxygen-independent coproporphyrinogen III oxidase
VLREPDETMGLKQYEILMDKAAEKGFIHYEISNFCRPEYISRHNTSYWLQETYLGIGPSANSYNRYSRQWNIRNNSKYIEEINRGVIPCTSEILTRSTATMNMF